MANKTLWNTGNDPDDWVKKLVENKNFSSFSKNSH